MSDGFWLSVIFGLLAVGAAGGFAWAGMRARRRGAAIAATETTPCAQVGARVAVGGPPGGGDEMELTECVGVARPGSGGVLTAPKSEQACVWHRTTLTHHYWDTEYRRDSQGRQRRERVRRTQTVSDDRSELPFLLADASGEVAVDPRDARMDKVARVFDHFEQRPREGLLKEFFLGDRTIGYQTEEWIIAPEQQLYVLGGAVGGPGGATLAKPDRGELLVSTRSEEQLLTSTRRAAALWLVGAGLAGALGVGLLGLAASLA